LTSNLIASISRASTVPPVLFVACLDPEAFNDMYYRYNDTSFVIPLSFHDPSKRDFLTDLQSFGTSGFNMIMFKKLDVLSALLPYISGHLIYVDSDVVFLKDPTKTMIFEDVPKEYDVLFQCDEEMIPCSLVHSNTYCKNLCAGVMLLRNTENTGKLLDYRFFINSSLIDYCDAGDQSYINIARNLIKSSTLPYEQYPNGSWLPNIDSSAVLIHYNWMPGIEKVGRMMSNGHWFSLR
jgi:hypothetical protein